MIECSKVGKIYKGCQAELVQCSYGWNNYKKNNAKLHVVHNSAYRLVTNTTHPKHISPTSRGMHYLPEQARVKFKILTQLH